MRTSRVHNRGFLARPAVDDIVACELGGGTHRGFPAPLGPIFVGFDEGVAGSQRVVLLQGFPQVLHFPRLSVFH